MEECKHSFDGFAVTHINMGEIDIASGESKNVPFSTSTMCGTYAKAVWRNVKITVEAREDEHNLRTPCNHYYDLAATTYITAVTAIESLANEIIHIHLRDKKSVPSRQARLELNFRRTIIRLSKFD